jgi:hypothetical protein
MNIYRDSYIIDMRILKDRKSFGLLNSTVGLQNIFKGIRYLVNQEWSKDLLINSGIDPSLIILSKNPFIDFLYIGYQIVFPIQKPNLLFKILSFFNLITTHIIVHDLFYLSGNKLLKNEFNGIASEIKKIYYNHTIKNANYLYSFSTLVKRQLFLKFHKKCKLIDNQRIFLINKNINNCNKKYDFFLPLSDRIYKGFWILDRIYFKDSDVVLCINSKYYEYAKSILQKNNPSIKFVSLDLKTDESLVEVYKCSKFTLCLSRFEGFGFSPFEAATFESIPVVLNISAMIELDKNLFNKLKLEQKINIEISKLTKTITPELITLCAKHISIKN